MGAFRDQVRVFVSAELSPQARAAKLAAAAQAGLAETVAAGRASPRHTTFVDGRKGAPEASVSGDGGVILYQFSYVPDAAAFAIGFLRGRSPVRSGRFRDSFVVSIDGRPVAASAFNPESVSPGAEIIIYNSQPYARKIDSQFIGKEPLHYSVPPNLFADCARAVRSRFGNAMQASRVYNISRPGKWRTRKGRLVETPALILSPIQ